jgi:putative nucleotidyltransferase with HDIG domain
VGTTGLATVGGQCGVCGCTDVAPLVRHHATRSGRHFAVASVAEVDMMNESGYGGIVLDRLATQTAEILAADQSCIFARDQRDPGVRIVAAAHGAAEDSIGKRVKVNVETAQGRRAPGTAVELRWDGEVQGALSVSSGASAREFSQVEIRVLRAIGVGAAAALAHSYSRPRVRGDIRAPIRNLATSLAELDPGTAEHSRDVVDLACEIGRTAGFSRAGLAELGVAALLHDVGKMRVPNTILNKPGKLTPGEREVIVQHPILGAEALTRVAGLEVVATLVRYHHERWDGGGYPDGLSGERIPRASRIISACDAYSAMVSDRPYRNAMTHAQALAELRSGAGGQFDAEVVAQLEAVHARRVAA